MQDFMMMEPTNQSFETLIGNGTKYTIPRFQRDYAWTLEQWEDLWADIQTLHKEHFHYMGYIVLQRKGQHDFEVIDGQQRLITLSLLILVAMRKVKDLIDTGIDVSANEERLKEITNRFIGVKDIVSLRVTSKLTLNRNNSAFYKSICSQLTPPNQRSLTATNKLLRNAFEFFLTKPMGITGEEIARFIGHFSARLMFTKIVVQDSLNAYKVFETLNARGVQLSTPDLLKNYIFSVIDQNGDVTEDTLNELDEQWSSIVSQLGIQNFTDFTRYHHNFQEKFDSKRQLFTSITKQISTAKQGYHYLDSLSFFAPVYAALLNHHDAWWLEQHSTYREITGYLEGLSLFGIRQPLTIIMAAFAKFEPSEFVLLVKYLYVLSIRYNVICHESPGLQENLYNQLAVKVFTGELKRASAVKNSEEYKKLYPNDDRFKSHFEGHRMPSRQSSKKIRFLLSEIEEKLGHAVNYEQVTLEHICPYNPDEQWYATFGEGANDVQDRLGNMVLLAKDDLKRADFDHKKVAYEQSGFALAVKVASFNVWNAASVNHYQAWLAEQAAQTWRVDYS